MKFLLDKNSIYNFNNNQIKDPNIYLRSTMKVIAKIKSIKEIPDEYLDIRYDIVDHDYDYCTGKKLSISFENNKFIADVSNRKTRKGKDKSVVKDDMASFRVKGEDWEKFKIISSALGTYPSKIINDLIKEYINKNIDIAEKELIKRLDGTNKGGNF